MFSFVHSELGKTQPRISLFYPESYYEELANDPRSQHALTMQMDMLVTEKSCWHDESLIPFETGEPCSKTEKYFQISQKQYYWPHCRNAYFLNPASIIVDLFIFLSGLLLQKRMWFIVFLAEGDQW